MEAPVFIKIIETWSLKSTFDACKIDSCFLKLKLLDYLECIALKIIPSASSVKSYMFYKIKPGYENKGYEEVSNILLDISSIEGYTIKILPQEDRENRQ